MFLHSFYLNVPFECINCAAMFLHYFYLNVPFECINCAFLSTSDVHFHGRVQFPSSGKSSCNRLDLLTRVLVPWSLVLPVILPGLLAHRLQIGCPC
jgi:hypothetical protein